MAYKLIVGQIDTAQHQADFEAAVNEIGVYYGGVSVSGTTVVQAVDQVANPEVNDDTRRAMGAAAPGGRLLDLLVAVAEKLIDRLIDRLIK